MKAKRRSLCQFVGMMVFAAAASISSAQETPATLDGVTVVDAARVQKMMQSGAAIFDVRVSAEYAEAHIKGAKSLPYREKSAKNVNFDRTQDSFDLAKLPADKSAPVVFYCNSGDCWKSYKASKLAVDGGFRQVHWFRGGLPEWRSKKLPVE